jgi:hypothetical protein
MMKCSRFQTELSVQLATGHGAVGAVLSVVVRYVYRKPWGKSVIEYMVFCLFASYVRLNCLVGEVVKLERSPRPPLQISCKN